MSGMRDGLVSVLYNGVSRFVTPCLTRLVNSQTTGVTTDVMAVTDCAHRFASASAACSGSTLACQGIIHGGSYNKI